MILINPFTTPIHLFPHRNSLHYNCTKCMKRNNKLTFSSRCLRRRWRSCKWSCGCCNWSCRCCRRCSQRYAYWRRWIGWVGWNSALTFRSYRNYRHVSPLCLSHHIYLHLHKSSTVPVLLAFSITAVSSQLWTADTTRQYIQSVPGGMDKTSGECSLC